MPVTPCHFARQALHLVTCTVVSRGGRGTWRHPASFFVAGVVLMALVARLVPVGGSGVVCARQKCLVCARQRLFVCARFFPVILSLYLCNMNLLVDVSSLHHHTTHHCVGFSSHHCVGFLFLGLHSALLLLLLRRSSSRSTAPKFLKFSHTTHKTHLTQLLSSHNSHNSSHTTHLAQLNSHNSSHPTHLTQLNSLWHLVELLSCSRRSICCCWSFFCVARARV